MRQTGGPKASEVEEMSDIQHVPMVFNLSHGILIAPGEPIQGKAVIVSMRGRLYVYGSAAWAEGFPKPFKFLKLWQDEMGHSDDEESIGLTFDLDRGLFLAPGKTTECMLAVESASGAFYIESSARWAMDFAKRYGQRCEAHVGKERIHL